MAGDTINSAAQSTTPGVSIGMPVYNAEALLAEALDSLLAQTFTDFEVLLNDNASTDRTEEICRRYAARDGRIRYERNEQNLGAAGNFNRVFARARGRYFKWFAHDDLLAPEYLAKCVAALDAAEPEVVLAFPDRRMLSPDGVPLECDPYLITGRPEDERHYDDISFPKLMRVCGSRCPIFVFGLMRREVAAQTQGMGNYIAADLVYVAEMRLRGRFRRVPGDLFFQRLHAATPEVIARTRRAGDAAWFDPKKKRRAVVLPEVKLLFEMVRAIHRSDVAMLEKGRCYASLGGHVVVRLQRWCVLRGKKLRWNLWAMWSAMSRGCLRAARVTSLPLRLWAVTAGARRGDGGALRTAVSRPWIGSNPKLLTFGAQRLHRRRDGASMALLADWLVGACPVRRRAAAAAMGAHAERFAPLVAARLDTAGACDQVDAVVIEIHATCGAGAAAAWRNALSVALSVVQDPVPVVREMCPAKK